jgi:hypothetical protein
MTCEHYIYLQEPEAESSPTSFSGIPLFAQSRSSPTAKKSSCSANEMESFLASLSGETFGPSMAGRGEERLMSSLEDSPAKTSVRLAKEKASLESVADSGLRWRELSVRFDPPTCLWKTHHCLWEEDLPWSSVTLPAWGMMRGGVVWERSTPELRTKGKEFGYWPTPVVSSGDYCYSRGDHDKPVLKLSGAVKAHLWHTPIAHKLSGSVSEGFSPLIHHDVSAHLGITDALSKEQTGRSVRVHPEFHLWLMGWPLRWNALDPLGTVRFQSWLQLHSDF